MVGALLADLLPLYKSYLARRIKNVVDTPLTPVPIQLSGATSRGTAP
jgi:hypothetical protein